MPRIAPLRRARKEDRRLVFACTRPLKYFTSGGAMMRLLAGRTVDDDLRVLRPDLHRLDLDRVERLAPEGDVVQRRLALAADRRQHAADIAIELAGRPGE